MPRIYALSMLFALAALAGCGDEDSLPDPTTRNLVDTVTVGSLTDTPITTASGFSVSAGAVRTDLDPGFDFAYDIEGPPETGRKVMLPRAALGITELRVYFSIIGLTNDPSSTSIPASRSRSPPPAARGFGSRRATTTRRIPD